MIRAQNVGQPSALPEPIPGSIQCLGVHGIDHDAVVEQRASCLLRRIVLFRWT